ncbi:CwfJ domain protein [Aspergillus saccharolyticus JOP 1030-1]|uniref:CwfJ domain protein n=1 Tax=Aspergillus saccharolyticus JOP 1030-1 TaxID=1450539 RepID=A0A318Z9Q4_9EURO|nr:CwfJ domain protein [Aspergillus saccharolyticus JOP 1030-1]PYH41443.1 CwfJ domain protein [Aspergillus saccharolyticus JOP 1030-1]
MASKIVVIGGVNCELQDVFTKLAKLHVKQNFSFAIIVGDLFGDCATEHELEQISALLSGSIAVPLPTYFSLGSRPLPTRVVEAIEANDEVCPNLYFLGRRGTLKTAEGIRIVSLGGKLAADNQASSDKYDPSYTEADARTLHGAHSADILITNQWPKGIRTGSKAPFPEEASTAPPEEVQCISDLCATLKPRYHLSSTPDFFFEREPFFHLPTTEDDPPDAKPLTRFISLASYRKASKQKWMYAFTLDPKAAAALTIPTGATASPFPAAALALKRKPLASQQDSYQRFDQSHNNHEQHRPRKRARNNNQPPPGPDQCFFCLSNPNIATHLITSIGEESYLTTAKGPLPTARTFSSYNLPFPGHMLIIPFTHTPTLHTITDAPARHATFAEMTRYRTALHAMLHRRAAGALGAVTWEVSRGNGIHVHWQFLPVPAALVQRGLVEAAFKVEAENLKYPRFEAPPAATKEDPSSEPGGDFFRVWIWSPTPANNNPDAPAATGENCDPEGPAGTENTLLLPLSPDFRFDLQFGRRVMAKLMELEKRIDWRKDVQSQQQEEADAVAFKEAFKEFDFTL